MVLPRSATGTKERSNGPPTPERYACLSRDLLMSPPIKHRSAPIKGALSVFEFGIAASVIALARQRLALDDNGIATVKLIARKSSLLKLSGLSDGGKNIAHVPDALDRLLLPVRVGEGKVGSLLRDWSTLRSGRVRLIVNLKWLPDGKFATVPMPLPTRGSQALALYLFLLGSDQRSGSEQISIKATTLFRRLGIARERDLSRALDVVNEHLRRLKSPILFDLVHLPRGRLFFGAVKPDQIPTAEDLAELERECLAEQRRQRPTIAREPTRSRSLREVADRLRGSIP